MRRPNSRPPGPFRILKAGVEFTITHAGKLVQFGMLYAVLLAAVWTALDSSNTGIPALELVSALIPVSFAWFWHRGFIIGSAELNVRAMIGRRKRDDGNASLLRSQLGFTWRAIALTGAVVIAFVVYAGPFSLLAGPYLDTLGYDDRKSEAWGFIFLSVMVLLVFPVARVLPVFAAIAIEERMSCRNAWEMSRGTGWRLALALIVVGFAYVVLLVVVGVMLDYVALGSPYDWIALNLGVAILSILFIAIAASCNAFLFDELTAWHRSKFGILDNFD